MTTDLIRTIEEDDDVPNMSEESDEEDDGQPKKNRVSRMVNKDFDAGFKFVGSQREYMEDKWNDLAKYCKKKAKTSLDDKIAKVRKERRERDGVEIVLSGSDDEDTDESLSDDELIADDIKTKERDARRKQKRLAKNPDAADTGIDITMEEDPDKEEFFDDAPIYDEKASFTSMNLSRPLLKAIEEMRFVHPTPIQAATIPVALLGRDICGCAATGTGKTAAYMLPVLERLLYRPKEVAVTRVLCLVPTRELGVQVYQVSKQLAQFTSIDIALSVGGLDLKTQESMLRKNPDIVIATPGRLIDHIKNTPTFSLESIEVLILDEADRMLAESFFEQMKEIIKSCARTRQTLLFSATMTDQVNQLAAVSLDKPLKVFVDSNKVVAWNLRQEFVRLRAGKECDREALLATLVCRSFRDHTMVFIQTKQQCHRLHIMLGLLGVRVGELHGNMSQPLRLDTLKRFKEDEIDVLLATDVAARGLDIRGVKTVINFTMPTTIEHYIHRVGRTARAGRAGRSVSIAGEAERKMVKEIVRRARDPVKSRVVPIEIVEKYRKKLATIEVDVKVVLEEEIADREIAKLENRTNQLQNKMSNNPQDPNRVWFQSKKERDEEKKKLMEENKKMTKTKQKKKAAAMIPVDPQEARERKQQDIEADFLVRQAKKNRKPKKMTVFSEDKKKSVNIKKGKAKSSFDADLSRKKGGSGGGDGGRDFSKKKGGGGGLKKSFKPNKFKK